MRKLAIIAALIVGLFACCNAQAPSGTDCPAVRIKGPGSIPKAGDLATFSAEIDKKGQTFDVQYLWSVSGTALVRGQGTDAVQVRWPSEGSMAVKVELVGLLGGCTGSATESVSILPAPEAVKLYEVTGRDGYKQIPDLSAVVKEIQDRPDNQLYILVGNMPSQSSEAQEKMVRRILITLTARGVSPDFITEARAFAKRDFIQIWRVPPGAIDPVCDECNHTVACPEIAVTGPSGITSPGDSMEYKAEISGDVPGNVRYEWTLSAGQIIEGQGTLAIKVRAPETEPTGLTATINIKGLPGGCPASTSETAPVAAILDPILVDEFVSEGLQLEKGRLETAASTLKERPDDVLYIIEHFPPNTSGFDIREKQRKLSEFLTEYTKLSEDNFKIVTAIGPEFRTRIYRIVSGSEFPEP